jgi:hypothetical protein
MKKQKGPAPKSAGSGWLVLARKVSEAIALEGPGGPDTRASITLLRTEPLTIELSLPQVGDVVLAFDTRGKLVRFCCQADQSVHVARAELSRLGVPAP